MINRDIPEITPADMIRPVNVVTRNVGDPDETPMRRIVDYGNHFTRIWLSKHIMWAMGNNYSVTVRPSEPD